MRTRSATVPPNVRMRVQMHGRCTVNHHRINFHVPPEIWVLIGIVLDLAAHGMGTS